MNLYDLDKKLVNILLVEDDDIDVMSMQRALIELEMDNPLIRAKTGYEAFDILRGENGHNKLESPYLILLDMNLPLMSGVEFLKRIRQDDELKSSIIFMLTTSSFDGDIIAAYNYNIAGYIIKAQAKQTFKEASQLLNYYWRLVEFPVN